MATAPVLYTSQDLPRAPDLGTEAWRKSGALLGDYGIQTNGFQGASSKPRHESQREQAGVAIRVLTGAAEARRRAAALAELSRREFKWLTENRSRYAHRWVALEGDDLLAVGESAAEVFAAIAGHPGTPLVIQVEPEEEIHFAGW